MAVTTVAVLVYKVNRRKECDLTNVPTAQLSSSRYSQYCTVLDDIAMCTGEKDLTTNEGR